MTRTPTSRPGLSLTEVLVALFVMALGIISLMTLFPLGAVQMGQALRDDRSGQTASQADGVTRIWWQTRFCECPEFENGIFAIYISPSAATLTMNPGHCLLVGQLVNVCWSGGGQTGMTVTAVSGTSVSVSGGSSIGLPPVSPQVSVQDNAFASFDNPVFLDPIGWHSRPAGQREWMTTSNPPEVRIPRRNVPTIANLNQSIRACSMMDDITFDQAGAPDTASGSTGGGGVRDIVREGAFNWCAVVQRPNSANRFVADFKVLVFHTKGLYGGHVPGTNPAGAETILSIANNKLFSANAGGTQVLLNETIANLPIRSGSWIMDGSNGAVANFYRIQSITESGTGTILELDTPIKPLPSLQPTTQIYIIRGLADVFDRPQLTGSGYQRQAP